MVIVQDILWGFSIISLLLCILGAVKKSIIISMASLSHDCVSPNLPSPASSSSCSHDLSWVAGRLFVSRGGGGGSLVSSATNHFNMHENNPKRRAPLYGDNYLHDKFSHKKMCQENVGHIVSNENNGVKEEDLHHMRQPEQNPSRDEAREKGLHDKFAQENNYGTNLVTAASGPVSLVADISGKAGGGPGKLRMRPARLVVPEAGQVEFDVNNVMGKKLENKEFEIQGRDYYLASKKGRRDVMEDGYGVLIDIWGDPKQAFFAVIDGHGGRAAADYVAANLGKNIVKELEIINSGIMQAEDQSEQAIRGGYLVTDKEFLSQGVSSGACAASVLLKDGELHVANVGDCRVVLSRKGVAHTLTNDHRLCREDERSRIENSGGYVNCRNGVWRVHGSLAVSRAIGDLHLKQWIIPEPEIKKLRLTSDCEFLIMASDGLWDKVNDQEAVDVVLSGKNSIESCKKLVDISYSKGNMDDITVMVINLENFVARG